MVEGSVVFNLVKVDLILVEWIYETWSVESLVVDDLGEVLQGNQENEQISNMNLILASKNHFLVQKKLSSIPNKIL
jgi:hypothetical protein